MVWFSNSNWTSNIPFDFSNFEQFDPPLIYIYIVSSQLLIYNCVLHPIPVRAVFYIISHSFTDFKSLSVYTRPVRFIARVIYNIPVLKTALSLKNMPRMTFLSDHREIIHDKCLLDRNFWRKMSRAKISEKKDPFCFLYQ